MKMAGWLKTATRYGFFPLMFFGVNGLGLAVIFSGGSPGHIAVALSGLVVLALLLAFGAERILPYDASWNRSQGDLRRDIAHFFANESLSLGPLLILPLFVVAARTETSSVWPTSWPLALQIFAVVALFDLVQNLFHWASHFYAPLWRLHAVHHEVKRMYALNGIMKHPVYQVLSGLASTLPLVLLGMPKVFSLVLAFGVFVQLLLQHSNVDYRTGPLRRVFATAEVHRFHHLRGKSGDVNFSLFFSFWDHALGNAYYDARRELSTTDIGLDYVDYPQNWWGQMWAPFQRFEVRESPQPTDESPQPVFISKKQSLLPSNSWT